MLALLTLAPLTACVGGPSAGASGSPPRSGPSLEEEVRALVRGFGGHVGVYALRLETGEEVALAADEIYPTASMVKVPLLVGLWQAAEEGRLDLEARLTWADSLHYESSGDLLNKLRPGTEVSLWQLAVQMIVLSDNTASLWIQGLVGGGAVNEWLAAREFEHTRVNSRVEGRRADWEVYGWGQSTPREMARLLVMIRNGEVVSEEASDAMYRLLSRSWWPLGATSVLPPGVNVAAKPGAVSAARSEVLLVNAPAGDYVLCVMTREQEDTRWEADNEGDALIRAVSGAVFRHWGGDA
ncbi:MAG: serine hydrolase [Gemmatimonadetes bacterium]|nr:serine hydrolase [Gemmatimonadota bacterium]